MSRRDVLWIIAVVIAALPLLVDVIVPERIWQVLNPNNFNVYYDDFLYMGLTVALTALLDFVFHATEKHKRHLLEGLSMAALAIFMVACLIVSSVTFGVFYSWSKNIVAINTVFFDVAQKKDLFFWSTAFLLGSCLFVAYVYQRTISNRAASLRTENDNGNATH